MSCITVNLKVDLKLAADLLCNAFEGGSNYWYSIESQKAPLVYKVRADESRIFPHLDYPVNPGGFLMIKDNDPDGKSDRDGKLYRLDMDIIKRGMQVMAEKYPRHFSDALSENHDADTGDVFLQCCLFGEMIYG